MRTIGTDSDDLAVQFMIRQMAIGIAVIGVILALAAQALYLLLAGGDVVLIGFGAHKVARVLLARDTPWDETPWPPVWLRIAMATLLAILILGLFIGWLWPVSSH
jgi:hypothetical protein